MLDKLKKMKPKKTYEKEAEMDMEELLGGEPMEGEGEDLADLGDEGTALGEGEGEDTEGMDLGAFKDAEDDDLIQELELRGFVVSKPSKDEAMA